MLDAFKDPLCLKLFRHNRPGPIQEQEFYLNKQEFQDALRLRYGWELIKVPSHCVCVASFSMDHAMICRHGGLTFIWHNELRNFTASWLHEVCHDVAV